MSFALITGATGGVGRAISGILARDGFDLFLTATKQQELSDLAAELSAKFASCVVFWKDGDLSDTLFIQELFKSPFLVGNLAVLVNNAGISIGGDIFNLSDDDWAITIAVNLTAPFLLTRAAIPFMINHGNASIINIASLAAVQGAKKPNYAASKAGLIGLTKSIAQSVGHIGIRANAIVPGAIDTDLISDWDFNKRTAIVRQTPLGRIAKPEEVAEVVSFLASDKSRFITGTTINVTGGQYMGN